MVTILVCGSREWGDASFMERLLDELLELNGKFLLVHGAAPGADTLAESWARKRQLRYRGFPAEWDTYGKAAGPMRNAEMLEAQPVDLVVAFKDGFNDSLNRGGTENMVKQARETGVPTLVYGHDQEWLDSVGAAGV